MPRCSCGQLKLRSAGQELLPWRLLMMAYVELGVANTVTESVGSISKISTDSKVKVVV